MPIPDFQTIMLPLLKIASDGKEHSLSEVIDKLGSEFKLTEAERNELLPSGKQPRFNNRVGWAKTYLKKTKLLEEAGRGRFRLTQRGRDVLKEKPLTVNLKYLERFPELEEFREAGNAEATLPPIAVDTAVTPEEALEASYQDVRQKLAVDLLDRVKAASPAFFEKLVVDLLVALGYGGSRKDAGQAVGHSGDGGIDGIIKEDRLGLDAVYIQAKRWDATVGRPVVQAFAGSLEGQRARKGVVITTSDFSKEAKEYVHKIEKKIVLIDGVQLAQLMIDNDVGVAEVVCYRVKKLDLDYFGEGE